MVEGKIATLAQAAAYPVSIVLMGIILLIITLPSESRNLTNEVIILVIAFLFLTVFNTQYFKRYKRGMTT